MTHSYLAALCLMFSARQGLLLSVSENNDGWWPEMDKEYVNDPHHHHDKHHGNHDLWTNLAVKYSVYEKMPLTEKDAKASGWVKDGDGCTRARFRFIGKRYTQKDEITKLIYGEEGKIAGIQALIKTTQTYPSRKSPSPWIFTNGSKIEAMLTAYFREPKKVCDGVYSGAKDNIGGDTIYIQKKSKTRHRKHFHVETIKLPKNVEELNADKKWVKGKCYPQMGMHYWYDIDPNSSCENLFPVFLLFGEDKLKSFGWALTTHISGDRWSHPTQQHLPIFFDRETIPTCLYDNNTEISTQHIYLTDYTKLTC